MKQKHRTPCTVSYDCNEEKEKKNVCTVLYLNGYIEVLDYTSFIFYSYF